MIARSVEEKKNYLEFIKDIDDRSKDGSRQALYLCNICGERTVKIVSSVNRGVRRTCSTGCSMGKHNMSTSREYLSWCNMKQRCLNPKNTSYPRYGGRGILICESWKSSFETFYKDMGRRPMGKSLDRRNSNKGYTKENCRWATDTEQANNRRNTVYLEAYFIKMTISDWASFLSVSVNMIRLRVARKWPVYDTLFKPAKGS